MSETKEINLTVGDNYDGKPIVIEFREGSALPLKPRRNFGTIGVALGSIAAIALGKTFNDKKADNPGYVTYNLQKDKFGITFFADPHDEEAPVVNAKLAMNPDLVAFGINQDNFFSGAQLIKHCRKYAHVFADIEQATALIKSLQNFDIKFESQMKKEDDRAGNTKSSVETALKFTKGEIPLTWKFDVPLFIGTEPVQFEVEIEIEADGGRPQFGFYSMQLETLIRDHAKFIIMKEVDKFDKFVTLEVIS